MGSTPSIGTIYRGQKHFFFSPRGRHLSALYVQLTLGSAKADRDGVGVLRLREFGQPKEGLFEIGEGAHRPTLQSAEEGEFAHAAVRVLAVKDGQALIASKAGIVKASDKGSEFLAAKERFFRDRETAEIKQGAVDAPFAAGEGDGVKGLTACVEVKMGAGIEADEVGSVNDL